MANRKITKAIDDLNTELLDIAAETAGRAFNISIFLVILVELILFLVTAVLAHWVIAFVVLFVAGLAGIAISVTLSMQARTNSIANIYHENILPKVLEFIDTHDISPEQWQTAVADVLSDDAPLRLMVKEHPLEGTNHE